MLDPMITEQNIAVYPTDPKWWAKKVVTSKQVLAYFELYGCKTGDVFNWTNLFSLNPNLCKIFAKQLALKIAFFFKKTKKARPKWITGDAVFAKEVAKALRTNFLSSIKYLQDNHLKKVGESPVLRVEVVIQSRELLSEYSKLTLYPLIGACLCKESSLLGNPEIICLATI
jgi:hypothetical protein